MIYRHALMLGVFLAGATLVGSALRRPPAVEVDLAQLESVAPAELRVVSGIVDAEFAALWEQHGLQPAPRADNLLIARRLSLALTGSVPSLEEIRTFEQVPPEAQIRWWLDHLFQDRRTSDYVAERLARAFVGTEEGPFLVYRRRRFVSWLSDCLMENRPYDEIVRSLLSDRGTWTDAPGINFLTVTNGTNEEGQPDPERLAARTTRAFLGVRLDCMQCHDDNLGGDWLQSDFHQLAAFFAEARSSGLGIHDTPRDYEFTFLGEDVAEVVEPKFPFAEGLDLAAVSESRRQQLADWVTHRENKVFSRAAVNRVWALLFGRPLADTIDDIPLTGPYPAGLEALAEDFAAGGFDLRRLIAQIALTRVFQTDSRAPHPLTAQHEQHWAAFPLTRLRPEQVAGAIVQSASLSTIDSNSHVLVQFARHEQVSDFVKRYGDTGEDEFTDHGGTIPQRLLMLNGNLVKERTKDDLFANAATRIAQQVKEDGRALELAFLCILSRRPSDAEIEHFKPLLAETDLRRAHRLEDLYWTLFNSAEFSWNH